MLSYDETKTEALAWIHKKARKGYTRSQIEKACKDSLKDTAEFLKFKTEDDDWYPLTVNQWVRTVDVCFDTFIDLGGLD